MTSQHPLPDDWTAQVYEALVEPQKWCIPVDAIALPWAWQTSWQKLLPRHADIRLFGLKVDVLFAMVDKPLALTKGHRNMPKGDERCLTM
jgi:hypothetical protein